MYSLFIVCVIDVILYVVLVGNFIFTMYAQKQNLFWKMLHLDSDKSSNVILFGQTIAHIFWLIINLCMLAEIISSSYKCLSADTCRNSNYIFFLKFYVSII